MLAACGGGNDGDGGSGDGGTTGGGGGTTAGTTGGGAAVDRLMVVGPGLPVSTDPHASADMATAAYAHQVFDSLFRIDPHSLEPVPNLVASYDRPNAQTLNITLRDGIQFHNGDPLRASDVEFSIRRAMTMPVSFIIDMIEDVVVHDDLNLTITTNVPFAPLTAHLAHYGTSIVSQSAVEAAGAAFHEHPIGTGAFEFVSITLGDRVELRRFEDYWGDRPEFQYLTIRVMPEATNRLIEVEAGNAHIALSIHPSDLVRAEESADLVLHRRPAIGAHYIAFNTNVAPFDNILVRQAVAHALDMETMSRVAFEGSGQAGASMITPATWGAIDVPFFEFNVDRARELMAEAGYADGFSAVLMFSLYDPQYAMVSQMVLNQLREIGIDISLQQLEWGTFLDAVYSGEHEMFILSWNTPTLDADYGMHGLSHSANANGGNNLANHINPEIDRLLEAGRSSLVDAERLAIYAELQHVIRNDAAYLFFHYTEQLHVASPSVQGFIVNPIEQHDLWRITFN